jgi:hypothetical protein
MISIDQKLMCPILYSEAKVIKHILGSDHFEQEMYWTNVQEREMLQISRKAQGMTNTCCIGN